MNKHTPQSTQLEFPLDEAPCFPSDLENYAPWVAEHGLRAPYGKCQCGCGKNVKIAQRTTAKYGHQLGMPVRFLNGHNQRQPFKERFWKYVEKTDECWLWIGAVINKYGEISIEGRNNGYMLAHRASWFIHFGPIPDGMFVCHHCDVCLCVRPDHLFLGTAYDNNKDMYRKGRNRNKPMMGEQNPNSKLTKKTVLEIRSRYAAGDIGQRKLAREYNVSERAIRLIVHRKTWKHVE